MDLIDSCNGRHKQCSRYHAELVKDYQNERYRQEISLENDNYKLRDCAHADLGLITFKDWLVGSRGHGRI